MYTTYTHPHVRHSPFLFSLYSLSLPPSLSWHLVSPRRTHMSFSLLQTIIWVLWTCLTVKRLNGLVFFLFSFCLLHIYIFTILLPCLMSILPFIDTSPPVWLHWREHARKWCGYTWWEQVWQTTGSGEHYNVMCTASEAFLYTHSVTFLMGIERRSVSACSYIWFVLNQEWNVKWHRGSIWTNWIARNTSR